MLSLLENKRDEHFCCIHVIGVFASEFIKTFAFIGAGSCVEKSRGDNGNAAIQQGGGFEEDTPGQVEQGGVERVADMPVDSPCNELSRCLE